MRRSGAPIVANISSSRVDVPLQLAFCSFGRRHARRVARARSRSRGCTLSGRRCCHMERTLHFDHFFGRARLGLGVLHGVSQSVPGALPFVCALFVRRPFCFVRVQLSKREGENLLSLARAVLSLCSRAFLSGCYSFDSLYTKLAKRSFTLHPTDCRLQLPQVVVCPRTAAPTTSPAPPVLCGSAPASPRVGPDALAAEVLFKIFPYFIYFCTLY